MTNVIKPKLGKKILPQHDYIHALLKDKKGIELGAAAHNPFNLPNFINVGVNDSLDTMFFLEHQLEHGGCFAAVDVWYDGITLPFDDNSQDAVVHSHVIEHIPNPVAHLIEQYRVVRDGGYIAMIFPKRDAVAFDAARPVTPISVFFDAFDQNWDTDTSPIDCGGQRRGHYWVFTLESMLELINAMNAKGLFQTVVIFTEETDSKVGNGHTVILRVDKSAPIPFDEFEDEEFIDG